MFAALSTPEALVCWVIKAEIQKLNIKQFVKTDRLWYKIETEVLPANVDTKWKHCVSTKVTWCLPMSDGHLTVHCARVRCLVATVKPTESGASRVRGAASRGGRLRDEGPGGLPGRAIL